MITTTTAQFKFVLVGDSAVGKSSILNRFVDDKYSQSFLSTIGVDFKFKKLNINGQNIKIQIWDTAGQETFRSIVSAYYSSADAIIIVYDISSYQSFENIRDYWIKQADDNNKRNAKVILIGNKCDLQKRQVQKFTIQQLCEKHLIQHTFEVSAKDGTNILQTFTQISQLLINIQKNNQSSKINSYSNNNNKLHENPTTLNNNNNNYSKSKQISTNSSQIKKFQTKCCLK